ncbi:glycoside-pentoside-hexuronide (GPH):cation symporter [Aestuariibacter sp. AA17]|uniref:Glycoside-pentoside-hexuronide (GPH):cation symporter n=1 Tax=Fluctibacter corallii TaxID=2984329 RepID=A0ABT3A773_9ALTE|nr:glycoside-pentoside-hexuronide (GPH):cation symporter [Aestuariibacter sp. AA17]MCV2884513.1 glycoside-pentoside-hexuronide (GPH):cation symporter [Aestuariibacter sp. AA17]
MSLSIKEKVAYGLGDTASNIVFQSVLLFLAYFYTDVFGISPAVVGTLFIVVRIVDAITDPLMGAINDRTQTRFGKFRPYLLWLAIPFAIISTLAFSTPDLSAQGKVIYAFATYTLLMIAYTAINIPYSALGGVLTADIKERVSVQSYRFVFGMLGGLLVATLTLPLTEFFGNGDKAKGYQLTIAALSALGVILFWLCFAGTKERIAPPANQSTTFRHDLGVLWQNDQWRIICAAAFLVLVGIALRSTLAIYYVKDVLGQPDLITSFITIGMIGNIIGCALAQPVAKRVCKVKAYIFAQIGAGIVCVATFFVPASQWQLACAMYFLWCVVLQMGTPLLWAKMADIVDYGQWQSGVRITGMTYSSIVFFIKLGLAVGGAMAGWLLAGFGYEANVALAPSTVTGIALSFSIIPAVVFFGVAWVMRRYALDDTHIANIQKKLLQS